MEPEKTLSIFLFENNELSPEYINHYFAAMKEWNCDALDKTQFIVVSQRPDLVTAMEAVKKQGINAELCLAGNEFVNGAAVWDVMKSIRNLWGTVRGRYVTFNHPEFIWAAGRLGRTCKWLEVNGVYLALGNLRRPARDFSQKRPYWRPGNCDRSISQRLSMVLRAKDYKRAAKIAEILPTVHWALWNSFPPYEGKTNWQEDVFFIEKEWADSWDAFGHGGELPFQDVYDIFGEAHKVLREYNLRPEIHRIPNEANRIIHLWHNKPYSSLNAEMRKWFFSNPKRWADTALLNRSVWAGLTAPPQFSIQHQDAKARLRRGKGGTVTRYLADLRIHLENSGGIKLSQFYQLNGKRKRNE